MNIKDKSSEIKFTKEYIQNTLIEIQDATQHQDYTKVKEIMKNYGLSASVEDIDLLRQLAKILDTEIPKERLLRIKEDRDFEIFKEKMKLHELYLKNDPSGVRAEIIGLNLRGRVLSGYNFSCAQIRDTDFSACALPYANFCNAYLYNVNFTGAILKYANLSATLYNVDFTDANLTYANLSKHSYYLDKNKDKKKLEDYKHRTGVCLNKHIIGWKKCHLPNVFYRKVLVKLEIPRGAVVFSINNDKCRTNMAKVLDIVSLDGKKHYKLAYAGYKLFKYRVGKEIFEPNFNCQYNVECAEGIHFFRNKRSAINYYG